MIKVSKFLKYWLPTLIWAALIFSFSSGKVPTASPVYWQDFVVKKMAHMTEYGIFAVLVYRVLRSYGYSSTRAGVIAVVVGFLYGGSDEIHQIFTQGRESRFTDVLFDTIGASLAILIIWKLLPILPKKLKNLAAQLELL